jgi:hypothetical protein
MTNIETRVAGIPCLIRVIDYECESGFAAKGLSVAWMLAPAKLYSRLPGNHLPEQRGLSGLASYHGKSVGIDYEAAGLRP